MADQPFIPSIRFGPATTAPSPPPGGGGTPAVASAAPSSGPSSGPPDQPFAPGVQFGPATPAAGGGAPPPAAETPGILPGMLDEASQGLTFGAGDKVAAYADALYDSFLGGNTVPGKTIAEKAAYKQQQWQQAQKAFEAIHPYLANAAKFGGMGLGALAMPELGLAKLGAAGAGALAGGLEGWGGAPISGSTMGTIGRTALGAGLGAGGGYLGGKAAGTLGDLLSVPAAGAPYAGATRAAISGAGPIVGPLAKGTGSLATMFALKHLGMPDLFADLIGLEARKPIFEGVRNLGGLVKNLPSLSVAGAPVGATAAQTSPSALAHALLLGYGANQLRESL